MEFILKSALLIGIIYSFYKIFLQKETFFKSIRVYFIIGLLATIILPLLIIPIYIEASQIVSFVPEITKTHANFENEILVEGTSKIIEQPFNWIGFLTSLYFIGIAFFSIKFIVEISSLYKLIHQSNKLKNGDITFVETIKSIAPFSVFSYIVYNKNQFSKLELAQIITHEKVHIKQFHTFDMLLVHLLVIVQWFNPFAWLYKKDLEQNLEFLADKHAQENIETLKEYQYLLLKTSIKKNPFALSTNFYNSLIKKRIIMLQKTPSKKLNQLKYVLVIPILVLFLYAFNTKEIIKPVNETLFPNLVYSKEVIEPIKFTNPILQKHVTKISSEFGMRKNPFSKEKKLHNGIDIVAKQGTNIYATANGKVVKATYNKLKGNYIQVQHANNYQTNYHHLDKIKTTLGEKVKKGEVISTVGSTGRSTGAHLHYEVVKDGKNVNPKPFLNYEINPKKNTFTKQKEKKNKIIEIEINKNSTQKQLNAIKKSLKAEGITIQFKKVKRNKSGEIISIKIDVKNKNSSVNYASTEDDGIKEITLRIEDDNISIGNSNTHNIHFTHKDDISYFTSNKKNKKHKKYKKSKKHKKYKSKSFHFKTDNNNHNHNDNVFIMDLDDDIHGATYIINGKKMSKEEFKKMDKNDIKTIEIKGDSDNFHLNSNGKSKRIKIITEYDEEDENGSKNTKEIRIIKNNHTDGNSFFYEIDDNDDENTITTYKVNGKKMTEEAFEKMDKSKIRDLEVNKEIKIKKKE